EARRRLLSIIQAPREETTAGDIDWAIGFFREHGALDFAESEARRLIDRGEEVVARLPLSDDGRNAFREIARFIVDRRV
ncbi:MAG TPA: hypothetical protein VK116_17445, partial [Planctomycetota bacterium]|nr:hypothetical protein [Planctomycetota bacterium]